MIKIQFSEEIIDQLFELKAKSEYPIIRKRAEVLYLKSFEFQHNQILKIARISEPTLAGYLNDYLAGGIEKLKEINYYQPKSELDAYTEEIKKKFEEQPPQTAAEAAQKIEEICGIKRSPTQIREFLKRIGLKIRKVGYVPGKQSDPEKQKEQEEFKKKTLDPLIEQAENGKIQLFFVDAAHFVLGTYLGYLWCFVRCFIKSGAGRQRFNVLAGLDFMTKNIIAIANDSYINAESVCELLKLIAEQNIGLPIKIILDNAKYQRCELVVNFAKSLNIELVFLPSYSPNFNLIERLWKFVKKKCLYSKYYSDFKQFKNAIRNVLSNLDKYNEELNTLLTAKFQTFDNVKLVTV